MRGMRRRTLLQAIVTTLPALSFSRVRLNAQLRTLTPEAIATLHEIAPTVLPASLGTARFRGPPTASSRGRAATARASRCTHGYGHPRLQKTGASPVPDYAPAARGRSTRAARANGAPWSVAAIRTRVARCSTRRSPRRASAICRPGPMGQHVVADLMAFYFRSSEANDDRYIARDQPRGLPADRTDHRDARRRPPRRQTTRPEAPSRAYRSGRIMPVHETDVCIIGGGITSAMLAEKLSELRPGIRSPSSRPAGRSSTRRIAAAIASARWRTANIPGPTTTSRISRPTASSR